MNRPSESLRMPGSYFQLVLRQCGTTRELREAILEGTGVSLDSLEGSGGEITLGQQLRQLRNINHLFPAGVALAVGAPFEPVAHGPLGFAAVSAPTLGAGLEVLARYCQVRNPTHSGRAWQKGDEFRPAFEERCALEDEERLPLIETFPLSLQGLVEAVLGGPMTEGRFEIAAPAPSYAARYRDYFHAEVRFGAEHTCIVIPTRWLALACPHADPG
ncbi:MAG: AraC family transcriptional regulator ligand-binding domain-containing protein, partial [bacterium]